MLTNPQRQTLSVEETAALLGISASNARRQIRSTGRLGPLVPIRIGRRIVFGQAQVDSVLAGEGLEVAAQ